MKRFRYVDDCASHLFLFMSNFGLIACTKKQLEQLVRAFK